MSEDWLGRWREGRTGWHEPTGNEGLKMHWPVDSQASPVLVPLCGKSPDLLWLADRGHEVVGVELSEIAARGFFDDQGLNYEVEAIGALRLYRAQHTSLSIVCGDYFEFDGREFAALYDRGAIVALPGEQRPRYVEHTKSLLAPDALRLIVTLEYDQRVVDGPPYSVMPEELSRYWSDLVRVGEKDDIDTCPPKFRKAGLSEISEVFWLSR
ncbi:MAG: thiopurine S-methyltransferase [Woeseiaceae bacterium]|nr:thiopurine S-methyltransferase [Woeseiaceae bacterium]